MDEIAARPPDDEVTKSSWELAKDWPPVLDPLYTSCGGNEDEVHQLWGQLVCNAAIAHDLEWMFLKDNDYPDGSPNGTWYFRKRY